MDLLQHIPELPAQSLDLVEDRSPRRDGFLGLVRRVFQLSNAPEARFVYDEVDRHALDAVVVCAHFVGPNEPGEPGETGPWVVLRSALRPPVACRPQERSPVPERPGQSLWELPAGLVEPSEISPEGLRRAAARELLEETGFSVRDDQLIELGPSTFPCPGVIAERQFFYEVRVELAERQEPPLDGSVLESLGQLVAVPLAVALEAAKSGALPDAKTELGLRRLSEALSGGAHG